MDITLLIITNSQSVKLDNNSTSEYLGYSPHDGSQYRCLNCNQIISGYSLIKTKGKCPNCGTDLKV